MWEQFSRKVELLRNLDRQFQVFGAEYHQYAFNPKVSESRIGEIEKSSDIILPEQLKNYYLTLGNGKAGINFGVVKLEDLLGFRALEDYTEVETLKKFRRDTPDEDDYFEVDHKYLTGLIRIEEEGCGHLTCVISKGERVGEIVHVSNDGYVFETRKTMIEYYEAKYASHLAIFEALKKLMNSAKSYQQIEREMIEKFDFYSTGDYISSIANIEKPASIFGTKFNKIYYGKTQNPWYEKVLNEWRNK
ncbi:MAG: SMI1/KNR4 family protein [Acidobacteriota bacterium]